MKESFQNIFVEKQLVGRVFACGVYKKTHYVWVFSTFFSDTCLADSWMV